MIRRRACTSAVSAKPHQVTAFTNSRRSNWDQPAYKSHSTPLPLLCGCVADAFSVARAPANILTIPLLPSAQAYSNIGPSMWLRGTIADQGFVHVLGSSIVNLYSIVLASRRVK